jgi:bacterioferritin-associated ferredoxin
VIVCLCEGLSDRDLRQVVRDGCSSRYELSMQTGAGRNCGSCRCDLKQIVREELDAAMEQALEQPPALAAK